MKPGASRAVFIAAGLLLALGVLTAAVVSMREPFALNDYAAIWGLKARALSRSASLVSVFRVDPDGTFSHPEYPPLWPLLLAAASSPAGRYDDLAVTPLWPALVLAASLLAARAARSMRVARPFALLAGAAVALLPYWRRYPGYAEGLLVVLLLAALGEVERAGEDTRATVRLSLFLTLAAWTKPEGLVAALAGAAVFALARRRKLAALVASSALLLAALPWAVAVHVVAPKPLPTAFALGAFSFAKAADALRALVVEAAPAVPLVLAGLAILLLAPETRRRRRALVAWAVLDAALLLGAFAFSRFDPAWHVRWSWDRILVVPLAVLIPALAEALAECVEDRTSGAPLPASPVASPP